MPRALLSVSDKTDLVPFARRLMEAGWSLVSTGGTAAALRDAGLEVASVDEVTGFPEALGGRVKTLHPRIHAGLLSRDDEGHRSELARLGIEPFDLVAVNLYPFREATSGAGVDEAAGVEHIDVGGPTMVRAAAKNHARVTVVVDPGDYPAVLERLLGDGGDRAWRRRLARKAFAHTAGYDAAIVSWLDRLEPDADALPATLHLTLSRAQRLRYGENPHQSAARYATLGSRGCWDEAVQHKGRALSYLNLFDADSAWRLVHAFERPAAVVVKHATPCGAAVADRLHEAYVRAFAGDPVSAFGGVVAVNRPMDAATAEALMANPKADVVIAPGYREPALRALLARRRAMRVLEAPPPGPPALDVRRVDGGLLVQQPDVVPVDADAWRVVTRRQPDEGQWRDLRLAWRVCATVSSNAIVLVRDGALVGVGGGQPSRVDAAKLAARKAQGRASGAACASDAFFPFRDGLDAVADAGVAAVAQPGGSVRDRELIDAADEHGIAMVFTGERHFRH